MLLRDHGSYNFQIRLSFQLRPTEPADYTGSYTRVRKRIVDTEIAMHQSSRRTEVTTAIQMLSLLKLTVSEEREEEEEGLRT